MDTLFAYPSLFRADVEEDGEQGGKGRMAAHRAEAAQFLSDGFRCRRVVPGGGGTVANSQPGQAEQQHGQGRGYKKGAAPAEGGAEGGERCGRGDDAEIADRKEEDRTSKRLNSSH